MFGMGTGVTPSLESPRTGSCERPPRIAYNARHVTLYVIHSSGVIASFRGRETADLFQGRFSKRFHGIARAAQRKLRQLAAARQLSDLTIFPGNRLEALRRDRAGQHSIRINDQFRICFEWKDGNAHQVEIVDYH